jgi:hypothetical protein
MPSSEYDLRYLQAGLIDLQGYLLSNELYWPVGASPPTGEPPYPRMTLGNLLLAKARLQGHQLTQEQKVEFEKLGQRLEATRSEWRVAWGNKAKREFSARLSLWRDFLEEYRKKPEANVDRYPYEVTRRATLELLVPEAEQTPPEEEELLSGLDNLLKAVFVTGEFVWDEEIKDAFPKQNYWFLYGKPKSDQRND